MEQGKLNTYKNFMNGWRKYEDFICRSIIDFLETNGKLLWVSGLVNFVEESDLCFKSPGDKVTHLYPKTSGSLFIMFYD
jgi:hypothetical protein